MESSFKDNLSIKNNTKVLVIDSNVPEYNTLVNAVAPDTELIVIEGGNGLKKIAETLEGRSDITGIHIISHGSEGAVYLGNDILSKSSLETYTEELNLISKALSPDGDLLFYGCNVANGEGRDFLHDLARLTKADIAASDDITGKSGDWELEFASGDIESSLGIDNNILDGYSGDLATFDFTGGAGTAPYIETVDTITMSASGAAGLSIADLGGFGGTSGNAAVTSAPGTVTISFDKAVDVSQLVVANTNASAKTIRLTPNTGSFVDSNSLAQNTGETVTVNFSGITSFTLTFTSGTFEGFFDNIIATGAPTGPTISSSTYDASTGVIVVTGTNIQANAGSDIDASKLTFTGEGGATYTLTDTADVERDSDTQFTLTLSATDKSGVNQILNKDGLSASSGTTYDLDGAAGFVVNAAGISDTDANAITVSNVPAPAITSAAYDYNTNVLTVTGTGFVTNSGATNDVDISMLTFTGEGGATYTLTSASDVEITNDTAFSVTLSGADITGVESLLNKDGTTSATSGTTYNLAGSAGFMAGDSTSASDTTGNGIIVSNYANPVITSSTYDWSTGQLVLTGTNFVQSSGATNDITASLFTLTGDGGNTYTLTSSNVEITSATSATITLNAADKLNVHGLLDKDGTNSDDNTTYNLAAADNWMAGSPAGNNIADATTGITVSSQSNPTITSAVYNSASGVITVTGTNFVKYPGATNDIDISTLTFTGEGGTYTLTSASDVEITSGTEFTITLSGADKTQVDAHLDKTGISSSGGTTYNLAAADNWMPGGPDNTDISDTTGNGITVSIPPAVTSATYNAGTGVLVVTGTNIQANGGGSDIDASMFTFTGEGGATHTLTDTSDVEITSDTEFTLTLSAGDKAAVNQMVNKDGLSSTGGTTYNLAAAADWNTNVTTGDTSDLTGNGITASSVSAPAITSAVYNASTGALVVTGTGFVTLSGAINDIDVSMFTFTGEGGSTYALTDSSDVEITSGTSFSVTLSATDKDAVNLILNKNGTTSVNNTTYNLSAAEDWAKGADAAVNVADLTGNGITVSGVSDPTITSSTYDASTGILAVTGTNFISSSGAGNDIDASKLTFTGEGGATYTLTNTSDVDVTSTTSFSLTLSSTDKSEVNQIINKDGVSSTVGTTYDIDGAAGFVAAAAAASDTGVNGITASNVPTPTITSAAYDYNTNVIIVTGTGFVKSNGASNDVDISKLTFTGEGGSTYTLTSASDIEITNDTTFSITLSGADLLVVESLLNKDGTASDAATTYNLAAAEDWMQGADAAVNIADTTGNPITVSNYAVPAITTAAYNISTGQLTLTGTNFVNTSGANNDIDVSLFTFTGEGGNTYTLTDSADVEITSDTTATITLSTTDKLNVHGLLNKDGTASDDNTTYNLAAAEDWIAGAPSGNNVVDSNTGITVSNVATPTITSATYDSDTGILIVTGVNFVKNQGPSNDVDISTLTFVGGVADATYTLTSSSDVEITSATEFQLTISGSDKTNVDALLDQLGTTSSGGSTYDIEGADNWMPGAAASTDISDSGPNAVTVTVTPKITSSAYNANTGVLTVTGANIQANGGGADIDASMFTFTGEAGETYALTDTSDVERTSVTEFSLTLSVTDKAGVNQILNQDGTSSTGGTTYNLAAADDWDTNVTTGDTSDTTGNGITVSNVQAPQITSSTYNWSTGQLVITGTDFVKKAGASNDIDASLLTITGEGAGSYTLTDTSNVDITSSTSATITLSATDKLNVHGLLSKDGTTSPDNTTYNLAAADNWMTGSASLVDVSDATASITVSNQADPAITSATYDAGTGLLTVTGTNFVKLPGASNDVDVSAFTFTGEGGTYTLTSASDVEIISATEFQVTLSGSDKSGVDAKLDKVGTSSSGGTTYNIAAADNWMAGGNSVADISDTAGNGITANTASQITSAAYDASTGTLVVTGINIQANGSGSDIDASLFSVTGEGGDSYTLTDTADVERVSSTKFILNLSATDKTVVNQIINKNGNTSTGGDTYNLAAADNWNTNIISGETSDITGNLITASNIAVPTITSATYDVATGVVNVTGNGFLKASGAANDIDVSAISFLGEGGRTYRLTDSSDVDISSDTSFLVTLSDSDKSGVKLIFNKNGTKSIGGTIYNLSADEDWAMGADAGIDVADINGNGINVINIPTPPPRPAITSSTYDGKTGVLTISGTNLMGKSGSDNDIIASKFIIKGKFGATYTLTDTANVDIKSSTGFTLILSATDKSAVDQLLNKPGTTSIDGTIYNLAASDDWAAGAEASINIADTLDNSITATISVDPDPDPDPGDIPSEDNWDDLPDNDGDGVPEEVEDFVPGFEGGNQGDGNGDGVPDKTQEEVSSVPFRDTGTISQNPNAPQLFVTLAVNEDVPGSGDTASLKNVVQKDAPADAPAGADMPLGLISFDATIDTIGASKSFSLFVEDSMLINGYWKENAKGEWVNLASDEYGGSVTNEKGKIRLDFKITDGGEFDSDGEVDGNISDPGAIGYLTNLTLFDEAYYLNSKLNTLRDNGKTDHENVEQVKEAMAQHGMTPYQHYLRYSIAEDTDPSAYFDTSEYLLAKTIMRNKTSDQGETDRTVEETIKAFKDAGFKNALDHFREYGWKENVNPSNEFDVSTYFTTKAAQAGKSVEYVMSVFESYILDPLTHYQHFGQYEDNVFITRVALGEEVNETSGSIELQGVKAVDSTMMDIGL